MAQPSPARQASTKPWLEASRWHVVAVACGPLRLHAVFVVKAQGGGMGQRVRRDPLREPAGDIGRAGGGVKGHVAERNGIATLQRAGMRGDGTRHLARPQQALAEILIIDHDVVQKPWGRGEGGNDPSGKAVGVDGYPQGGRAAGEVQIVGEGLGQQGDVVVMADQAQAGVGCGAGFVPADQQGSGCLLQRLDALRYGRGGDVQIGGGKVERPAAVNGGKGGQLGGVKH